MGRDEGHLVDPLLVFQVRSLRWNPASQLPGKALWKSQKQHGRQAAGGPCASSQLRPSVADSALPRTGHFTGRKAEPHTDCSLKPLIPALTNPP